MIGQVKKNDWVCYIVECSDGSYYTGTSNNPEARVKKHNSGKGAKYTRARRPVKLIVYSREMSRSDACKLECSIKSLPRSKKIASLMKMRY